ncbi:MAG: YibE/F family protein [Clostridia bacterium]|nr:YibE/F family protein [Clostridia bacterium]
MKEKIVFTVALVISILYIIIGNKIAMKDNSFLSQVTKINYPRAEITRIIERKETPFSVDGLDNQYNTDITFEAHVKSGKNKGQLVIGTQSISTYITGTVKEVQAGDNVLLYNETSYDGQEKWYFMEYSRTSALIVLTAIFLGLIVLFGRTKGIKTLISLVFTVLSIFMVFIPAILGGQNIYAWTIVTCTFITISTVLLVYGYSRKTLATALGCIAGVLVAGLLTVIMNNVLKLTGFVDENAIYLEQLNSKIDLKAIIFAGILVGAVGAIMDVSIDISSSLTEVASKMEKPDFKEIVKSGFNIGKDIMGTMTNTLILAYIGSSLSTVLLLTASSHSVAYLFNLEMITVEILQALAGSIGILTTIPLTSVIAAALYRYVDPHRHVYKYRGGENKVAKQD